MRNKPISDLESLSLALGKTSDENEILTLLDEFVLPSDTEQLAIVLSTAYSNYQNMSRKNAVYIGWLALAKRAYFEIVLRPELENYLTIVSTCQELQSIDVDTVAKQYKSKLLSKVIFGLIATLIILAIAGYILVQAFKIFASL